MERTGSGRFLLIITVAIYVAFGLVTSVIGVIIDKFQVQYNVSLNIAALLPFAFYLSYGLFSVPFGVQMDRLGAKTVLISGMVLMTLGCFFLYLSNNYVLVIIMIFLAGIGVTAIQTAGNPFIRELDTPARYTANLTIIIGVGALGYAFSPFYPLREKIFEKFRIPVFMDNDANALLLGESLWGAGKGFRTILGFTLGTGLGCAIVIDNKLFTGSNGMSGEIWPSPYKDETIEDTLSGRGISKIYHKSSGKTGTAREISLLAKEGDHYAIKTWNVFGEALGYTLAWGVNMVDPGIVIIGGSIANSFDLFNDSMDRILRKYICPVPAEKTRVVKALLGDNAGFIGAGALVMQVK